jgi:hypothetical protein
VSVADWIARQVSPQSFRPIDDETIAFESYGAHELRGDIPGALVVTSGAEVSFELNGVGAGVIRLGEPPSQIRGTGAIDRLEFQGTRAQLGVAGDVSIREVGARNLASFQLVGDGAAVGLIELGEATTFVVRRADVIGCLHVAGPIRIDGEATVERVSTDLEVVELFSGTLNLLQVEGTRWAVRRDALLRPDGESCIGMTFQLDGGRIEFRKSHTEIADLLLGGHGEVLVGNGSTISGIHFGASSISRPLVLTVSGGAEVIEVSGSPYRVNVAYGVVAGGSRMGLAAKELSTRQDSEVENVDFFDLSPSVLAALEEAGRVTAWWPPPKGLGALVPWRDEVRARAREVRSGNRSAVTQKMAVAHYWSRVERLLNEKHAPGRDLARSHELAEHTRRLAAEDRTERRLLTVSSITGYGSRVAQPLAVWVVVAAVFALAIRGVTTGIGSDWSAGLELYWHVLTSPVTWVRPLSEGSVLQELTRNHVGAEVLAFVGRAFGTFAVLSTALAVRRYIRPT